MEYKVGDTVKIKNNLCNYSIYCVRPPMLKYEGQKTKIIETKCNNSSFRLAIDNGTWIWDINVLEPINKNKIFHSGNFININ